MIVFTECNTSAVQGLLVKDPVINQAPIGILGKFERILNTAQAGSECRYSICFQYVPMCPRCAFNMCPRFYSIYLCLEPGKKMIQYLTLRSTFFLN